MANRLSREQIVAELIPLILNAVNLQHIDQKAMTADTSLAGTDPGSLGLDSVDILEAVVVVEHHFAIKIENAAIGKKAFRNFGSIADYILDK